MTKQCLRMRWHIALWISISFAGCYSITQNDESPVQTEEELDSKTEADSKQPVVQNPVQNPSVSNEFKSLIIEMQPNSARICPGDCIDIEVKVRDGNPPYTFLWDQELSSVTTPGPHRVCPETDTKYTVTIHDTGVDSDEFEIPAEQVRGSTNVTVIDDCATSVPPDAGVDAYLPDASEHSDTDASDIGDASPDAANDADGSAAIEPCQPNCPDFDWVVIPGGTYQMGSPEESSSGEGHQQYEVTIETFKILRTEVTVEQFRMCVEAEVCDISVTTPFVEYVPSSNLDYEGREKHPMNGVSWYLAKTFAEWAGARLPSDAEWEYAARNGGQDILYPWGNEEITCNHIVQRNCGDESTQEVCSRPAGNTAQGLCDMSSNVAEWIEDSGYNIETATYNASTPFEEQRGYRGGTWGIILTDDFYRYRSTARIFVSPSHRDEGAGFRIAKDMD